MSVEQSNIPQPPQNQPPQNQLQQNQLQQPQNQNQEKKLKVVIGLPGTNFTHSFLLSWSRTLIALAQTQKYDFVISFGKSSFVSFARMQTMQLDVLRGKNQKAFNGDAYDVFVSIDSDIVYSPDQLFELIEGTRTHPVVSGYYMMQNNMQFSVVKDWNKEYFLKNGTFQFLQSKDLDFYLKRFRNELDERKKMEEEKKELPAISDPDYISVSYVGMGFFACRKEVLDSLQYPFFYRKMEQYRTKEGLDIIDMCSEDVSLCKNIEEAGYDIMLNTRLRVGHEKHMIL
jgi:cellulose synthase/poly-beta-1,6-N-acetylglucosamine synthase-like glycosyltransferase